MQELLSDTGSDDVTHDERMELLQRIAASAPFRRATRLREFLLYVGACPANHADDALHEATIGTAVFKRPDGYDTSADNIVRVSATELRKRLEMYFSGEGAQESILADMPRGAYALIFRRRSVSASPAELPAPVESVEEVPFVEPEPAAPLTHPGITPVPVTRSEVPPLVVRGTHWMWKVLAAVLVAVCAVLLTQNLQMRRLLQPWQQQPAVRALWGELFVKGTQTDLVLADTSFALAQDIESRQISLKSYINNDYKQTSSMEGLSADRQDALARVLNRNTASVGDFIAAKRIIELNPVSPDVKLKFAREYSAEEFKTNNAILIGSRISNPWVDLFNSRLNFRLQYDVVQHRPYVENVAPKPGEKPVYDGTSDLQRNEGYSVVALLPNLGRSGYVLILEGTDSQATRSAGEFATSESALGDFFRQNHVSLKGSPPGFEVLLHNYQIIGTPFRSEIVAWRIEQ